MLWTSTRPVGEGKFKWRPAPNGRVHNVRVRIHGGVPKMQCKTMDVRTVAGGGEWAQTASDSTSAAS